LALEKHFLLSPKKTRGIMTAETLVVFEGVAICNQQVHYCNDRLIGLLASNVAGQSRKVRSIRFSVGNSMS
jgi:hypothetical protein